MADTSSSMGHTRVSRETRRLLAAAVIAFLTLSVLARIRFPDQPAENPVAPVLTQLTPRRTLGDLAAELSSVRRRIEALVVTLDDGRVALRVSADSVATWRDNAARATVRSNGALDRPTGLELLRVQPVEAPTELSAWTPEDPSQQAFIVAASASTTGVVVQPVYVPTLQPRESAVWAGIIWQTPADATVTPGTLLFSTDAELAGLAVRNGGGAAIVPTRTLLAAVRRLSEAPPQAPGFLGIEVQPLTRDIGQALGADDGLVIAWVSPDGPAAATIRAGDVIAAINGVEASFDQWQAVAGRLAPGETITLTLARSEERTDVIVAAVEPQTQPVVPPTVPTLGLTLRRVTTGAEVTAVAAASAASTAGLRAGDIIYMAGPIDAPTPAQLRAAYQAAVPDRPLLIGVARGSVRQVLTLRR